MSETGVKAPAVEQTSTAIPAKQNDSLGDDKPNPYEVYKEPAAALLTVATFAATITFNIIFALGPEGQITNGLVELAYANSLFCIGIIGSVFIIIGIAFFHNSEKLRGIYDDETLDNNKLFPRQIVLNIVTIVLKVYRRLLKRLLEALIPLIYGLVGLALFVGFYLMIHASVLYLKLEGPFIFGSVVYLTIGYLVFSLWGLTYMVKFLYRVAQLENAMT